MKTVDQQSTPTVLSAERNSIIIEDWLENLDWTAKLACCFFHTLLTSKSDRLQEIGTRMKEEFDTAIVETSGLTSGEDLFVRELYFAFKGDNA